MLIPLYIHTITMEMLSRKYDNKQCLECMDEPLWFIGSNQQPS